MIPGHILYTVPYSLVSEEEQSGIFSENGFYNAIQYTCRRFSDPAASVRIIDPIDSIFVILPKGWLNAHTPRGITYSIPDQSPIKYLIGRERGLPNTV